MIVQHLAQCGDCRDVVFLSSPDQTAMLPVAASDRSNWLSWPVLRWGAAVVAVVVVVAAVSLHHPSGGRSTSSGAIQQTDVPIAKERAASAFSVEMREPTAVPAAVPAPSVTNGAVADAEGKHLDQLKKQSSRVAAPPLQQQKSDAREDKVANKPRDEGDKTTTVEVTSQAVTPQEAIAEDRVQVVPGRAKDAAAKSASNAGSGIGGGTFQSNIATASRPRSALVMPMVAPRWTLTAEGALQRSLDFGRSWQTVQVPSQGTFRALAASGKDIWVAGSQGALYHSTDAGQNWAQVQPVAAGQTLTDDIIGVEFPDTLHGKLTTSSQQTWTTEDGGQSWSKQ